MQNLEYTPRGAEEALALNAVPVPARRSVRLARWQAVPRRGPRFAIIYNTSYPSGLTSAYVRDRNTLGLVLDIHLISALLLVQRSTARRPGPDLCL